MHLHLVPDGEIPGAQIVEILDLGGIVHQDQVPGVDMVVYGPFDYALNAGWEMVPQAKELAEVHRQIIETSLRYGVRPLILVDDTSQIQYFYDLGARDFSIGDEMQMHINFYNKEYPVIEKIMGIEK